MSCGDRTTMCLLKLVSKLDGVVELNDCNINTGFHTGFLVCGGGGGGGVATASCIV